MLIDDGQPGQAEPRRQRGHPHPGRRAAPAITDHVFADEGSTGGGARDMDPGRIGPADRLGRLGPAEDRRQAQLVAAGHEDPGRRAKGRHRLGAGRVGTFLDVEYVDAPRSDGGECVAIGLAGVVVLRGRRNDRDPRRRAAAQFDETSQDRGVPDLLLRAADRNHKAAFDAHHAFR